MSERETAERIAARVPLPECMHRIVKWPKPSVAQIESGESARSVQFDGYTADQLRAYGLACVREAMRGGDGLPMHVRSIQIPTETMEQEFQRHYSAGLEAGKRTAPPAGRVEVSEATDADIEAWLERHDLAHAIRGTDARAAFEDAQTWSPLAVALQEPDNDR